ncbi:MAG: hypothetical protein IPL96_17355 [Holophagaceae bacterium]|nr:hypothetical protein [Holophagaceae bacterium]
MRLELLFLLVSIPLWPQQAPKEEWWAISKLKGYSADSLDEYRKFSENGLHPLLICLGEKNGTVTGSDLNFVKLGESTLVGVSVDERGMETVEVYQLDRVKRKLLYTKSRVRTGTVAPILPDTVMALVGSATPVPANPQ